MRVRQVTLGCRVCESAPSSSARSWPFGRPLLWGPRSSLPCLPAGLMPRRRPGASHGYAGGCLAKSRGQRMSEACAVIRILTVDDHPLIREGIAHLVARESDMQVVAEADNGREAIQQFRMHRPDVTLMDLQMPEMSGLDAVTAIRSELL